MPVLLNSVIFAMSVAFVRRLASPYDRAISHLFYAEKIFAAPHDLLIVSMGVVLLPSLARYAAAREMADVRRLVTMGLRMSFFFGIPSAVGLVLLARPVVDLVYVHGRFGAEDARATASALAGYAIALVFSGHLVLYQAFYALRRTGAILAAGIAMLGVTVVMGVTLVGPLREAGLALAFSGATLASSERYDSHSR